MHILNVKTEKIFFGNIAGCHLYLSNFVAINGTKENTPNSVFMQWNISEEWKERGWNV